MKNQKANTNQIEYSYRYNGEPVKHEGRCDICPLKKEWGAKYKKVFAHKYDPAGTGVKVLLVGEAPGFTENSKGIPFIGKMGRLLRSTFEQVAEELGLMYTITLNETTRKVPVGHAITNDANVSH